MVLLDLNARIEQTAVERARSMVQKKILDAPLQQQHHPHAARGGVGQRMAKPQPGRK